VSGEIQRIEVIHRGSRYIYGSKVPARNNTKSRLATLLIRIGAVRAKRLSVL
jgi:hypothetical protein